MIHAYKNDIRDKDFLGYALKKKKKEGVMRKITIHNLSTKSQHF